LENQYNDGIFVIANMKNITDYIITLLVIALAPAIVEETFFRGCMQQMFNGWFKNAFVAIFVTSIIFSAVHVSYYGFLPRVGLGVILGLIFYYGKNIWLNILMHFLNNAIAVTQLYLLSKNGKLTKEAMNTVDDKFPLWLGVVSLLLLMTLFYRFKKESNKVNTVS
jgi:membrane protease YdiL (CAAX protease family)